MIWQEFWNTLLSGDMLLALFYLILALISTIVSIILYPFSYIISSNMPAINAGLELLVQYFNYATTYLTWLLDALAVPVLAIILVSNYYLFMFTVSFVTWTVKLFIHWKGAIWK